MEEFTPTQTEKTGIQPKDVINWGLVIAGGLLLYRIFRGTGIIKSTDEAKQDALENKLEDAANNAQYTNITKYTDLNFWKQKPPANYDRSLHSVSDAMKWAEQMYNTHTWYNDDEEAMLGLIKKIQYQVQYSWLAYVFQDMYKQDLTSWLKNYFSGNFIEIFAHLNGLPTYRKI